MATWHMTGCCLGARVLGEVRARGTRDNALALMVVLAVAAFMHFNPAGVAKPLEDAEVVDRLLEKIHCERFLEIFSKVGI
jgi:hypothetical protein